MVKHVILWKLDENKTEAEKAEIKKNMKRELEGLVGKVPGLIKLECMRYFCNIQCIQKGNGIQHWNQRKHLRLMPLIQHMLQLPTHT